MRCNFYLFPCPFDSLEVSLVKPTHHLDIVPLSVHCSHRHIHSAIRCRSCEIRAQPDDILLRCLPGITRFLVRTLGVGSQPPRSNSDVSLPARSPPSCSSSFMYASLVLHVHPSSRLIPTYRRTSSTSHPFILLFRSSPRRPVGSLSLRTLVLQSFARLLSMFASSHFWSFAYDLPFSVFAFVASLYVLQRA